MLDPSKQYTYADYLTWKFEERVELFRGFIARMSAPNRRHQEVSMQMTGLLFNFFKGHNCRLYSAPFDVRLPKPEHLRKNDKDIYTVVQPDLCVVCDLEKLDERGCVGAPDLVVEILSPGNSKKEMTTKFDLYQEHGVKEYWIIDPTSNFALVYTLDEQTQTFINKRPLEVEDTLRSNIFPGLEIEMSKVFE